MCTVYRKVVSDLACSINDQPPPSSSSFSLPFCLGILVEILYILCSSPSQVGPQQSRSSSLWLECADGVVSELPTTLMRSKADWVDDSEEIVVAADVLVLERLVKIVNQLRLHGGKDGKGVHVRPLVIDCSMMDFGPLRRGGPTHLSD